MIRRIFAIIAATLSLSAVAQHSTPSETALNVWTVSYHAGGRFNNFTPGVGIEHRFANSNFGVAGGVYYNSVNTETMYGMGTYTVPVSRRFRVGGAAGMMYGYPAANGSVSPLAGGAFIVSYMYENIGGNLLIVPPTRSSQYAIPLTLSFVVKYQIN